MPAKVDTSEFAVTGLEVSNIKPNTKTPETDLERGDQPYRHRWEFVDRKDDDSGSSLIIDVFKCFISLGIIAVVIIWAVGVISTVFFAIAAGVLGIIYIWMVFNSSTFNALSKGCLTTDEFFEKMEAMYAADWKLQWKLKCYHMVQKSGPSGYNAETGVAGGHQVWYERVDTHKASMIFDKYSKCNDVSLRISKANIKEGNIYRFLVDKNVKSGDEVVAKQQFIAKNKRDKHYEITEKIILPPECKTDSFLVARDAESLPMLFTTMWYVVCNITVILTVPYDIYFCCKTKVFPIEVVKEFWIYPENHQSQKATCLDDIGGEQGSNEGTVLEPPMNANKSSANSPPDGQTNDGFDDKEVRKAIALSLQENVPSQA